MATYVLIFIGFTGRVEYAKQIEGLSDEQAIKLAGQETGDYRATRIEIWDGIRMVGLVGTRVANPQKS